MNIETAREYHFETELMRAFIALKVRGPDMGHLIRFVPVDSAEKCRYGHYTRERSVSALERHEVLCIGTLAELLGP